MMKTGNRKCWHIAKESTGEIVAKGMTQEQARQQACTGEIACMDGFKIIPCHGEAHDPRVAGNIDHCMVCLPNWGFIMVTDADSGITFWFDIVREARDTVWNSNLPYTQIKDSLRELEDLERQCYRKGI